ncbi:MAG: HAD family phosphatase [Lentisphaeria bacterium]
MLFDLGNVLVGLDYAAGVRRLQPLCPLPAGEVLRILSGSAAVRLGNLGELAPLDFFQQARELLRLEPGCDFQQFRAGYSGIFQPRREMGELLAELAPQVRLGILSNTDMIHWHAILEQFDYVRIPPVRVLSYEVGLMKPDPRIYRLAVERLGVAPAETLFIDDLPENVAGARQAGLRAVPFTTRAELCRELRDAGLAATG